MRSIRYISSISSGRARITDHPFNGWSVINYNLLLVVSLARVLSEMLATPLKVPPSQLGNEILPNYCFSFHRCFF